MSYRSYKDKPIQPDDGSSVIGPLIGTRRPRYEILDEVIDDHLASCIIPGEEFCIFINLTSMLRQFFSEYSANQLTRGELERHPRDLAAEIINVAGHYRNYVWKRYNVPTSVFLYHSTEKCNEKILIDPLFKQELYEKRIEGNIPIYKLISNYTNFNIRLATEIARRIPHVHVVNTGSIDPEAWPWAVAMDGRVNGSALVLSAFDSDLQYALNPGVELGSGRKWAVFRPSGENSRLTTSENVIAEAVRTSKEKEKITEALSANHILYMLALSGESVLGVEGLPKFGMTKAAKHIMKCVEKGHLPPDAPSLQALLTDGILPAEAIEHVSRCWKLLVHSDYASTIPVEKLSAIESTMVNYSGIGEIEKVNATYFNGRLNIDLIYAGEEF